MDVKEKIKGLRDKINFHNYRYYVLNDPVISDYEYDILMKELQELEKNHPELITADSPTQRVGDQPTKVFPAFTHSTPMLSLSNTYTKEEVIDFDRRVKGLLGNERYNYVTEIKIDGAAICLVYKDGIYLQGATRGNGVTGDDITQNLKTIKSIPLKILKPLDDISEFEVRGEVFMKKDEFIKLNNKQEEKGGKDFCKFKKCYCRFSKIAGPKNCCRKTAFRFYLLSFS